MSLKPPDPQRSFYHTSYLCDQLFSPTDRYRLFRERILPMLLALRAKLESLYCEGNGRPATDPVMLAGVTLLQFMEKVPDRAAAQHVVHHLGWKYALDLELTYGGFHPTVLVYFRDRLEQKGEERVIFDGVLELLMELGLVKSRGKQRLDSTHVLGCVKQMSWLECAQTTVRVALERLGCVVPVAERPQFWERLWACYVEGDPDWRLSGAQGEERYRQCGQDMQELVRWIEGKGPEIRELKEARVLQRVFEEQFEVVDGRVQPRGRRVKGAVQNPHDPDAHFADKLSKKWVGYKVHVAESVDPAEPSKIKGEPGEHFITEMITTEAAQDEMSGLAETLSRQERHHGIKPEAIYTDAGYVTERTLTEAEQNGIELLGPTRPDPHLGPYNTDAFCVDMEKKQAICPQGKVSTQWSRIQDTYMATQYYRIEWANQCDSCIVQKQCTRSRNGRRLLVVGLRHDLVHKRRGEMKQEDFSRKMHPRNGVEGTLSELVRGHGLRRTKFRGTKRVRLSHYLMGAACNVKRYLNLMAFQMSQADLQTA